MIYHDGQWTDDDKEVRNATSLARTRGVGVFNTLRTHDQKVLFLEEQIGKLVDMANELGASVDAKHLEDLVHEVIERNPSERDVSVRIIISPGAGQFLGQPEDDRPIISVMTHDIEPLDNFTATLKTVPFFRQFAELKHTNYFAAFITKRRAEAEGFYDIVYTDGADDPKLLEASTNNLLFVKGQKIIAPDSDIYPGLSRRLVLENAASVGFEVEKRDFRMSELPQIDGVYMTGVTYGPRPVVKIDQISINTLNNGTHEKLHKLYSDIIERSVR
ncbi:MAG: aminotransferase class IV [Candidatus Saccharimonadales bacterium]|nr:aminotransferase class IV [Candidatus Saccharimonadales bacterium]